MPNLVVHFEIPADDLARAKAFYEKTFGWTIKPYPMPPGAGEYLSVKSKRKPGERGIDGGMMKRNMPNQPFTNYITVKSIDDMNQTVQANGGIIVMPKQEVAKGMGWISVFKDPENNFIGLHQAPPGMTAAAKKAKKAPSKMTKAKNAPKRAAKKAKGRKRK